jgi:hypothetical protein
MNAALVLQFMSQDKPWAFGLRHALDDRNPMLSEAPLHEAPFFAVLGPHGNQFRVFGDDLEDCMQTCLDHPLNAQELIPPQTP